MPGHRKTQARNSAGKIRVDPQRHKPQPRRQLSRCRAPTHLPVEAAPDPRLGPAESRRRPGGARRHPVAPRHPGTNTFLRAPRGTQGSGRGSPGKLETGQGGRLRTGPGAHQGGGGNRPRSCRAGVPRNKRKVGTEVPWVGLGSEVGTAWHSRIDLYPPTPPAPRNPGSQLAERLGRRVSVDLGLYLPLSTSFLVTPPANLVLESSGYLTGGYWKIQIPGIRAGARELEPTGQGKEFSGMGVASAAEV